mmetsp:Transcript_16027/g.30209  ORF Transcript_16027/g.30209 Transcript_16027/m.30209 type:complete len:200 (+) Transcript_16027:48-647(+)
MSAAPSAHDGTAGSAAAAVGNAALSGARMGAAAAQRGVVSLSIYVQHNPAGVKIFCCIAGLALSVISILSIVGVAKFSDEDKWTARDSLQNVYTFFFGLVIVAIDMKEDWANRFFGLQSKIFLYCQFLASQTGRALFYFYVGSMSIFLLQTWGFWMIVYIVLGGGLCLLGLIMLVLRWCPCCQDQSSASAASASPVRQS